MRSANAKPTEFSFTILIWAGVVLGGVAVLYGGAVVITKHLVGHLDPVAVVLFRFIPTTIGFFIIGIGSGKSLLKHLGIGSRLGVVFFVIFAINCTAIKYTYATNASFITSTFIVFTALAARIMFGVRIGMRQKIAIAIALAGFYFLNDGLQYPAMGDVFVLLSALLISWHLVLTEKYRRELGKEGLDPVVIGFQQAVVVTVLSFLFLIVTGEADAVFNPVFEEWDVELLLFMGAFIGILGMAGQIYGQNRLSPVTTAFLFTLMPISSAVIVWGIGMEAMTNDKVWGLIAVVMAILLGMKIKK